MIGVGPRASVGRKAPHDRSEPLFTAVGRRRRARRTLE